MPESDITVSIIIPMRNEARYIGKCLDSVLANQFPRQQYEILVIDGDSTDGSRAIVLEMTSQHSNIRLLHNQKRIAPTAMNMGIRQACGRYIIRMDAHSEYPPDYIGNCILELERSGAANVGGRWITRAGAPSRVARAIAYLTQNPIAVGNAAYRTGGGGGYVDTVPFGAFRREIFEQVGLYREDLVRHQDFELNARIRKAGGTIYLSPLLHCVYYNVPTFSKFMRQAYLNGIWCARAWTRYPVSFCWRHAAPLALVAWLLLTLSLGIFFTPFLWLGLLSLCAYFLFSLAAGAQVAATHGWKYLFLIPVLMFSYHFVYGGFTLLGFFEAVPRLFSVARPQPSVASPEL